MKRISGSDVRAMRLRKRPRMRWIGGVKRKCLLNERGNVCGAKKDNFV